jgi:hypothetical protein
VSSDTSIELVSATTLIKDALGTSRGIIYYGKEKIANVAFDKSKLLQQFIEDGDRDGWVKYAMDQEFAGLQSAANRGTEIHQVAEQLALGVEIDYDEILEPYIQQYRRFLTEHQPEFLLAEAPVYNKTYRYAGTLDGIARLSGSTVVMDIKTTAHGPNAKDRRGNPKLRPPFPEVALQLTLYRRAELVGLLAERKEIQYRRYYVLDPGAHLEPMPQVDGGVCVVVSPEDYMVVPVDTSERVWKACRHVIQVARFQTETAKLVFGPPLAPAQGVLL